MDSFDKVSELRPHEGPSPNAGGGSNQAPSDTAAPDQASLRLQKQKPSAPGQRKEGERPARPSDIAIVSTPPRTTHPRTTVEPASPTLAAAAAPPISAGRRPSSPFGGAVSPSGPLRSPSPRHLSPATSQIFERDVQESTTLGPELSPAIPSHIQTEDHIPPVLEASSLAITDQQLNPDEVEIVMHSEHRPAAAAVAGGTMGDLPSAAAHAVHPDLAVPNQDHEETGSTYGAVDPMDPRRLSFISFADVVHAENVETGKESSHLMSPASLSASALGGRSPSPVRSPLSDRAPASPLTGGSPSAMVIESSPVRGGPGSMSSGQGHSHGELTIETMRQTMERPGNSEPGIQPQTPV